MARRGAGRVGKGTARPVPKEDSELRVPGCIPQFLQWGEKRAGPLKSRPPVGTQKSDGD